MTIQTTGVINEAIGKGMAANSHYNVWSLESKGGIRSSFIVNRSCCRLGSWGLLFGKSCALSLRDNSGFRCRTRYLLCSCSQVPQNAPTQKPWFLLLPGMVGARNICFDAVHQGSASSKVFYGKARKNLWLQAATLGGISCVLIAVGSIKRLTLIGQYTPAITTTMPVTNCASCGRLRFLIDKLARTGFAVDAVLPWRANMSG